MSFNNQEREKKNNNGKRKNKLESPLPKDTLCQFRLKLVQYFVRRFFFILSVYFRYLIIISPWKMAWHFIWTSPKDVLCQVCLKLARWFLRRRFLISSMDFRYLVIISPWKRGWGLLLNQFESSSPTDALCQVWLKLVQWFWKRR